MNVTMKIYFLLTLTTKYDDSTSLPPCPSNDGKSTKVGRPSRGRSRVAAIPFAVALNKLDDDSNGTGRSNEGAHMTPPNTKSSSSSNAVNRSGKCTRASGIGTMELVTFHQEIRGGKRGATACSTTIGSVRNFRCSPAGSEIVGKGPALRSNGRSSCLSKGPRGRCIMGNAFNVDENCRCHVVTLTCSDRRGSPCPRCRTGGIVAGSVLGVGENAAFRRFGTAFTDCLIGRSVGGSSPSG